MLSLKIFNSTRESLDNFRKLGGSTVIDVTTQGLNGNPEISAEISRRSRVNVIMGSGYYVHNAHKEAVKSKSVEEISADIVNEWENGFKGFEGKYFPGLIG